MTAAFDLYRQLSALGVTVWRDAERLRYRAPANTLTAEHLAAMRDHKAELLALLAANDNEPETAPSRAFLHFRFVEGGGGTVVDPDGLLSAVESLHAVYGSRLDLRDLLATVQHTPNPESQPAADLVCRLLSNTRGNQ